MLFKLKFTIPCILLAISSACNGSNSSSDNDGRTTLSINSGEINNFLNNDYRRELTFLTANGPSELIGRTDTATLNGLVGGNISELTTIIGDLTIQADFSQNMATITADRFDMFRPLTPETDLVDTDFQPIDGVEISGVLRGNGSIRSNTEIGTMLTSTLNGSLSTTADSGLINGLDVVSGTDITVQSRINARIQGLVYHNDDTNKIVAIGMATDGNNQLDLGFTGTIITTQGNESIEYDIENSFFIAIED